MSHARAFPGTYGTLAMLALAGLLIGCPPSPPPPGGQVFSPPTVTGAAVNGVLTQGQASAIEVTVTASDSDGLVEAVSADLRRIGGSQAQPLEPQDNNLWRWGGVVVPPDAGTQRVFVIATDDDRLTDSFAVDVTVFSETDGPIPPEISNLAVTGSLTTGLSSAIVISATVLDPDGTVQAVTADLLQVGGVSDQPLTQGTGNLWTFNGTLVPTVTGTRTITVNAVDNQGNVGSQTTTIVVSDPLVP